MPRASSLGTKNRRPMVSFMKPVPLAICLCLANEANAQPIENKGGEPPGYYAGLSRYGNAASRSEWQAWLNKNRDKIAEIQDNAKLISSGEVRPQCIGAHLYRCVASLASKLWVADWYEDQRNNVFHEYPVDVNGKTLFPKLISMDGFLSDAKPNSEFNKLHIQIDIDPHDIVKAVSISLPRNPLTAHTEDEYARTGLYEAVSPFTSNCPQTTRIEVAQFFENRAKPAFKPVKSPPVRGVESLEHSATPMLTFCNQKLRFEWHLMRRTRTVYEQSNFFGRMTVEFR